jgi:uncharacterized protein (DUF849 family)
MEDLDKIIGTAMTHYDTIRRHIGECNTECVNKIASTTNSNTVKELNSMKAKKSLYEYVNLCNQQLTMADSKKCTPPLQALLFFEMYDAKLQQATSKESLNKLQAVADQIHQMKHELKDYYHTPTVSSNKRTRRRKRV